MTQSLVPDPNARVNDVIALGAVPRGGDGCVPQRGQRIPLMNMHNIA